MTSTNIDETLILKTDVLGRVRMPANRREAILDAFECSGMSGQAFAAQIGVKYPTFATWVQKRRRERGQYPEREGHTKPPDITFVQAHLEKSLQQSLEGALEVQAVCGAKLVVRSQNDVVLAAGLLRSLTETPGC